jgi:hypothetical protein
MAAGVGLMAAAHGAHAQGSCTFTDENGKTVTWPNCQPPADTKSAPPAGTSPAAPPAGTAPAKSFPYPGDTPASAPSHTAAQTGDGQAPGAPVGNKFPYPGDPAPNPATAGGDSKPRPANGDPLQDAGSSGSSNSSSSSSSSEGSDAGPLGADDDPAEKAAEARVAARRRASADPKQTSDERETEDLKVAAFYQNDSNFKGAYDRAKDAVSLEGDDADAHLALADAARRLGKLDEAETNYKKCLTLDPIPKTKKAAEKALREMSGN